MALRPDYVTYGGLGNVPGPLHCNGTTLYAFGAECDYAKLDALCRRCFAGPSHGAVDYRPLGPHVMITFGVIDSIVPGLPPFSTMGHVTEPQVAIWIPAAEVRAEGDDLVAHRFVVFNPFIWLDNPISLASGREVYGYPKTFGWPVLPEGGAPGPFRLDVFGMDYERNEQPRRARLLELEPIADNPLDDLVWEDLLSLGRHFRAVMAYEEPGQQVRTGLRVAGNIGGGLVRKQITQLFFKQIRAADDGLKADLQQIVEAPTDIRRFKARRLADDYRLRVHPLDSHPLAGDLGLADQDLQVGYEISMDFTIQPGRIVWDVNR